MQNDKNVAVSMLTKEINVAIRPGRIKLTVSELKISIGMLEHGFDS
jgi:hypothetical protein